MTLHIRSESIGRHPAEARDVYRIRRANPLAKLDKLSPTNPARELLLADIRDLDKRLAPTQRVGRERFDDSERTRILHERGGAS